MNVVKRIRRVYGAKGDRRVCEEIRGHRALLLLVLPPHLLLFLLLLLLPVLIQFLVWFHDANT